jgi:hypothetical protein
MSVILSRMVWLRIIFCPPKGRWNAKNGRIPKGFPAFAAKFVLTDAGRSGILSG